MDLELILCLTGNLFGIYIISRFFALFFEKQGSNQRKWFRFVCYSFYYIFNSLASLYFFWPPVLILSTNVIGCLLVSWSYKGKWKHRIRAVLLIVAMSVVCEDVVYYYFSNLHIKHLTLIVILSSNLLYFMLALLLQKVVELRHGEEIAFLEWIVVIIVPVCSLLVSIVALDDCKDELSIVVGGISMIVMTVFLFVLLDRIQHMHRNQLDLALLEQQNQAYESQMKLMRDSEERVTALRHDLKNHFLVLNQLAEQSQCTEVTQYIHRLMPLISPREKIVSTGNPVIDGFLNLKLNEAATYGAKIDTEINISSNLPIAPKEISIVLGNLLDNAIRALKECESHSFLAIIMRQEPGILFIEIKNSHNGRIHRVGNMFKTTKEQKKGHGIGLKNVQRVVEEYHGQMEINNTEESFFVKLVMFI